MSGAWQMVSRIMSENRGLSWGIGWNVVLLVGSLAALPFDQRTILGWNPWIKPIKFEISVMVFLATIGWMLWALGNVPEQARTKAWMGWGIGVAMIVENTIIVLQSARGVRSHMNFSTPLDTALFNTMGVPFWWLRCWRVGCWCCGAGRMEGCRRRWCGGSGWDWWCCCWEHRRRADGCARIAYGGCGGWVGGADVYELEHALRGPAGGALFCAACVADLSAGGMGGGYDASAERYAGVGADGICGGVFLRGVVDVCGGDAGRAVGEDRLALGLRLWGDGLALSSRTCARSACAGSR